jgi:hypothetical protein
MSKTIWVKSPTFQINLNDPSKVYYNGECSGNCKTFIVSTYQHGVPNPTPGQIAYKYHQDRGAILDLTKSSGTEESSRNLFIITGIILVVISMLMFIL